MKKSLSRNQSSSKASHYTHNNNNPKLKPQQSTTSIRKIICDHSPMTSKSKSKSKSKCTKMFKHTNQELQQRPAFVRECCQCRCQTGMDEVRRKRSLCESKSKSKSKLKVNKKHRKSVMAQYNQHGHCSCNYQCCNKRVASSIASVIPNNSFQASNIKEQFSRYETNQPPKQKTNKKQYPLPPLSAKKQALTHIIDNYENILNQRLQALKKKYSQLQILQKTLQTQSPQSIPHAQQQNHNTLRIQNQFYIAKITELQNQLKIKDQQLRDIRGKCTDGKRGDGDLEMQMENKRVKEENLLLERENRVLKQKLKDLGVL